LLIKATFSGSLEWSLYTGLTISILLVKLYYSSPPLMQPPPPPSTMKKSACVRGVVSLEGSNLPSSGILLPHCIWNLAW